MTWQLGLLLLALWVLIGLLAVLLLLHRRGHRDGIWYLLGAVLGPLMVPLAYERARVTGVVLERQGGPTADGSGSGSGLRVLVGVDGSPESDQAVRDAGRLVSAAGGQLVLATVLGADSAEREDGEERDQARALLDRAAEGLPLGAAQVETRILAGLPAATLLEVAADERIDVMVVGRRGRGLSRALLGSVATRLSTHSPRPVLLATPVDAPR